MPDNKIQQDPVSRLYNNIKNDYDLPDFNTFKADMLDSAKANKLHSSLVKDGYEMPSFDVFSVDMGLKKKERTASPSLGTQSQLPLQKPKSLVPSAEPFLGNTLQESVAKDKTPKSEFDNIEASFKKGQLQGKIANTLPIGRVPNADELAKVAEYEKELQSIPDSENEKAFATEGFKIFKDPLKGAKFLTEAITNSLSALFESGKRTVPTAVGMGAAMGAPFAGVGAGVGAGTGLTAGLTAAGVNLSTSGKILELLQSEGVDVSDKDSLVKAFSDENKMSALRSKALKYGLPIALFDVVSGSIGGKLIAGAAGKSIAKKSLAGLGEAAIQSSLGSGGELAGQVASGQKVDWNAVALEGVTSLATDLPDVAVGAMIERKKASSNNKTIAKQVGILGKEVGTEDALHNLNRDLANKVITPQEYEEGVSFVEKAAAIDNTIPETIKGENRATSIELIDERQKLEEELTAKEEQKKLVDVAFHKPLDEANKELVKRMEEINKELGELAKPENNVVEKVYWNGEKWTIKEDLGDLVIITNNYGSEIQVNKSELENINKEAKIQQPTEVKTPTEEGGVGVGGDVESTAKALENDGTKELNYIKQYLPDLFKNINNQGQLEDVVTFVKENIRKDKKLTNTKELEEAAVMWLNKTKFPEKFKPKAVESLLSKEQPKAQEVKAEQTTQPTVSETPPALKDVESTAKLQKGEKKIYHHTQEDISDIKSRQEGTWFTTNEYSPMGARAKGKNILSKVINDSKLKLATDKEYFPLLKLSEKERAKKLIEQGFDGVKRKVDGDVHYLIFDLEKLSSTTKSESLLSKEQPIPTQEVKPTEAKEEGKLKPKPIIAESKRVEVEPEAKEGVKVATLSGMTESERAERVKERQKETGLNEREVNNNDLIKMADAAQVARGNEKSKIQGAIRQKVRELNSKLGDEFYRYNGVFIQVKSKSKKVGDRFVKAKGTSRDSSLGAIKEGSVLLMDRDENFKRKYEELVDSPNLTSLDVDRGDGVRMTEAQIESAVQDIADGIPSVQANNLLNALEDGFNKNLFDLKDKTLGRVGATLDEFIGVEKEDVTTPMDEEALMAYLEDEANMTKEEKENINDLINEYEQQPRTIEVEGEIPEAKPTTKEGGVKQPEPVKKREGEKAPETELVKQYKEAAAKVSKKAKENAKKEFVDRNFDSIVEKLKISIKCPT